MTGTEWLRRQLDTTPAKLRAMQLATALVCVLVGVLGVVGVSQRQGDLRQVARAADSLLQVQAVRVDLVGADSLASESYLLGGQERPAVRQQFVDRLTAASRGLVAVSQGLDPGGADLLAGVSSRVSTYAGLIEQARSNNRQGFPVGAAYQRQANRLLSDEILPALRESEQQLRDRVNQRLDAAAGDNAWIYLPGLLAVAAVIAGSVWLQRRFRRLVNVALVAGGAVVVVAMFVVGQASTGAFDKAEAAVGGQLQRADLIAQIRSSVFDARSQESLTLINRGNGAANEAAWAQSMANASAAADEVCAKLRTCPEFVNSLDTYEGAHREMRALDDNGNWDEAVAMVVGEPTPSTLTVAAQAAVDRSATDIDRDASAARTDLGESQSSLDWSRWLVALGGLVAAGLVVTGYSARLAEYR